MIKRLVCGKIENVKADLHPTNYRLVVFQDLNSQTGFLVKSTAESKETIKWEDGQTYPLVKLHVTSASHPFYTGQEKMIDIEGRVDKYKNRQKSAQAAADQRQAKTAKAIQRQKSCQAKAAPKNPLPARSKKAPRLKPKSSKEAKPAQAQGAKPPLPATKKVESKPAQAKEVESKPAGESQKPEQT